MYRCRLFTLFILLSSLTLCALLIQGQKKAIEADADRRPVLRQLVSQLGLTDLSIWSEARYTRHPSQADLFTAFQDYPGAFDHFPAGSIIGPGDPQTNSSFRIHKKVHP